MCYPGDALTRWLSALSETFSLDEETYQRSTRPLRPFPSPDRVTFLTPRRTLSLLSTAGASGGRTDPASTENNPMVHTTGQAVARGPSSPLPPPPARGHNPIPRRALHGGGHYRAIHPLEPVVKEKGREVRVVDVVGPICETGDFLAQDREMPLPSVALRAR